MSGGPSDCIRIRMCRGMCEGRRESRPSFLMVGKKSVTLDDELRVNKMVGQKPVAKFSAGQVSAALWENDIKVNGTTKTVLKASISRRYKDNTTGEWKSGGSFGRNEIPLAIHCLQQAFERIVDEEYGQAGENAVEEEVVT